MRQLHPLAVAACLALTGCGGPSAEDAGKAAAAYYQQDAGGELGDYEIGEVKTGGSCAVAEVQGPDDDFPLLVLLKADGGDWRGVDYGSEDIEQFDADADDCGYEQLG